jgi:hypothetical protein
MGATSGHILSNDPLVYLPLCVALKGHFVRFMLISLATAERPGRMRALIKLAIQDL